MEEEGEEDVGGQVTTQEMGWARAWLSASTPGMSTGYESGCWTSDGEDERSVDGKAREDRYVAAARKRSLQTTTTTTTIEQRDVGFYSFFIYFLYRTHAPGERPSPLGGDGRDVRAAPLPLGFPGSATVERRAVQVRAAEPVELRGREVQRRSEFVGRWERAEVRRVDEGVVAAGERGEINVGVFGRDSEGGGEGGKQKKEVTSHVWACDPVEADVDDYRLSFGPSLKHGCILEYGQQRTLG